MRNPGRDPRDLARDPAAALPSPGRAWLPRHLTLQWHLTERCDLRCSHCYQESFHGAELDFGQWLEVLDQLEAWRVTARTRQGSPPRFHLNLTGGEPFVHPQFLPLLEVLAARRDRLSFSILSNGQRVEASLARRLAELRPGFVQVSLEGGSVTHDCVRGPGSFARAVTAIQHLVRAGVPVLIAFTAHHANYREFAEVARLGVDLRVRRVWADRLLPMGAAAFPGMATLSPPETREFLEGIRQARTSARRRWFHRTEVAQHRALQFLTGQGEPPYRCTAGESLLALLPNGDLLPCRRLPIRLGNVLETPMARIYEEHPLLQALREPGRAIRGCEGCAFHRTCRGGLRCLAYARHGDPFVSDPGCWLSAEGQG